MSLHRFVGFVLLRSKRGVLGMYTGRSSGAWGLLFVDVFYKQNAPPELND